MTDKLKSVFLVWGIRGEYSSRTEWPVAAYTSEADAQAVAIRLKELSRDLYAIYSRREDELAEAGDWDGTTLLTTTDEGRAFVALHGAPLAPGTWDFDDMEFTCCEVPLHTRNGDHDDR
jgi:arylsulfatase A-like enzyme